MGILRNFILVVLNLVGELWTGFYNRKPEYYDEHTVTKTKVGYIIFVILATIATFGIVAWIYNRVY